jgi:hypothetical protein
VIMLLRLTVANKRSRVFAENYLCAASFTHVHCG